MKSQKQRCSKTFEQYCKRINTPQCELLFCSHITAWLRNEAYPYDEL